MMPISGETAVAKLHGQASDLTRTSTAIPSNHADDFPQGCSFSPDGSCILTSIGKTLRLYNTADAFTDSDWKAALHCSGAESIRSFAWYPHMQSHDPSTCCFLTTSRDQPVHLYDAYTGKVRAAYCPYNALDELEAPNVAIFHPTHGQTLVAGGFRTDRRIYVFDVHRPGRQAQAVWKLGNTKRSTDGQKGLVSALAYSRQHEALLAVGTYAPGSIYLYDVRQPPSQVLIGLSLVGHGKHSVKRKRRFWVSTDQNNNNAEDEWISSAKWQWLVQKTQTGVTHLQFDDAYTMFSASRRSNVVLAWDLRMFRPLEEEDNSTINSSTGALQSYSTVNDTNQRLGFDFDAENNTLFVGGRDGTVRLYNAQSSQSRGQIRLASSLDALPEPAEHSCAINGISYHRMSNGSKWLAVSTGERRFPAEQEYDDDDQACNTSPPGNLQLYQLIDDVQRDQNMSYCASTQENDK
jgi:WD40 repeat protein